MWHKMIWRLLALIVITVLPPVVIVATTQDVTGFTYWQVIVALSGTIVLWFQFCLQYSEQMRRLWIKLKAQILNPEVSLSLSARFAAPDLAFSDEVIKEIRRYYAPQTVRTATLSETGETYLEMPGWSARFKFYKGLDEEYDVDHSGFEGFLIFTLPDMKHDTRTALNLVKHDVNQLFQNLADSFGLKLEAINVSIRFVEGSNPYLAAYLSNIKSSAIKTFECTVDDSRDAYLTIRQASVAVYATNPAAFMSALLRHLIL